MNIKSRIEKLEGIAGGTSGFHYIVATSTEGESKEEAIARALDERGITLDQLGYLWYVGHDGLDSIDNRNYESLSDLIGYREIMVEFKQIAANLPPTIGPPSERHKLLNPGSYLSQSTQGDG